MIEPAIDPLGLDDGDERLWGGLMRMSTTVPRLLERDLQSGVGISLADFGVLGTLAAAGAEPRRIGEIALVTGLSFSRTSRSVSSLAERGLVIREACEKDGRGFQARLTPAGRGVLSRAVPGQVARARQLVLDSVDDAESEFLQRLLHEVADRAEANGRSSLPATSPRPDTIRGLYSKSPTGGEKAGVPADAARLFDDLVRCQIELWNAAERRVKADGDVPLTWYEALRVVIEMGSARATDVSKALRVTESGVGKLLTRLHDADHLERRPDPADARAIRYSASESGRMLARNAESAVREEVTRCVSARLSSEESAQLSVLLGKLRG